MSDALERMRQLAMRNQEGEELMRRASLEDETNKDDNDNDNEEEGGAGAVQVQRTPSRNKTQLEKQREFLRNLSQKGGEEEQDKDAPVVPAPVMRDMKKLSQLDLGEWRKARINPFDFLKSMNMHAAEEDNDTARQSHYTAAEEVRSECTQFSQLNFSRSGWLIEQCRDPETKKLTKRKAWFVVRDCMLLGFKDRQFTAEFPLSAVSLRYCKVTTSPKSKAFMVMADNQFRSLECEVMSDKEEWVATLRMAHFVTHENMIRLAYFNLNALQHIEDQDQKRHLEPLVLSSEYAPLAKTSYVATTTSAGGLVGFLDCHGPSAGMANADLDAWALRFAAVRDSFLLVYDLDVNDAESDPVFAVHLSGHEGTGVAKSAHSSHPNGFVVRCDDVSYHFAASSAEDRDRWLVAIDLATRISVRTFLMATDHQDTICNAGEFVLPSNDLLGVQLPPLCEQPFDSAGNPIHRHPKGHLVLSGLDPAPMGTRMLSREGRLLDPFMRPLPPGASPMYVAGPRPVGVGVDGKLYSHPDGQEVKEGDEIFDHFGRPLNAATVAASLAIASSLQRAVVSRACHLSFASWRAFDVFGRAITRTRSGDLVCLDGQTLGPSVPIFNEWGKRIQHPPPMGEKQKLTVRCLDHNNQRVVLGTVLVEPHHTTLHDVYTIAKLHIAKPVPKPRIHTVVFMKQGCVPVANHDRKNLLCEAFLPSLLCECRDAQGHRGVVNGEPFEVAVDHKAVDAEAWVAKESQFVKAVRQYQPKPAG